MSAAVSVWYVSEVHSIDKFQSEKKYYILCNVLFESFSRHTRLMEMRNTRKIVLFWMSLWCIWPTSPPLTSHIPEIAATAAAAAAGDVTLFGKQLLCLHPFGIGRIPASRIIIFASAW